MGKRRLEPKLAEDVNGAVSAPRRLVVGISGASGVIHGVRTLDALRELGVESHLVVSRAALLTLSQETDFTPDDLMGRADVSLIGVALPEGGRTIELAFVNEPYKTGRLVTRLAVFVALLLWAAGAIVERRRRASV